MRGRIILPDAWVGVVLLTQVDASDAILVVGSSLEVYSAFRFVERVLDFQSIAHTTDAGAAQAQQETQQEGEQLQQRRRQRRKRTIATKPICVLNLGETRADRAGVMPLLHISLPCDEALWGSLDAEMRKEATQRLLLQRVQ